MMIYISTPEKEIYRAQACSLVATTTDGEIKIFANHAPLLAILRPGLLRVDCMPGCQCPEMKRDEMFIAGGFLEVQPDVITVLANSVERTEQIDARLAELAVQQAREQLQETSAEDANTALLALEISMARLNVVKRMSRKY